MNPQFSQPKGSVSKETNKDSIARKFGCKKSEVLYAKAGSVLTGYKVIYDKVTQRSYALPSNLPAGATITSLTNGILVHSAGTVDLGTLAVLRGEFVILTETFSSGATIRVKNELIGNGVNFYRWGGSLPKTVGAGDAVSPISPSGWITTNISDDYLFALSGTMVNVKDPRFGARGDWNSTTLAGTDDSAAFQAAIDSLTNTYRNGGYRCIYVPTGNYKVSGLILRQALEFGVMFIGDGKYCSIIWGDETAGVPIFTSEIEFVHFRGLSLYGSRKQSTSPSDWAACFYKGKLTSNAPDIDVTFTDCALGHAVDFVQAYGRGVVVDPSCVAFFCTYLLNIVCDTSTVFPGGATNAYQTGMRNYNLCPSRTDVVSRMFRVTGTAAWKDHIYDITIRGTNMLSADLIGEFADATITQLNVSGISALNSFSSGLITGKRLINSTLDVIASKQYNRDVAATGYITGLVTLTGSYQNLKLRGEYKDLVHHVVQVGAVSAGLDIDIMVNNLASDGQAFTAVLGANVISSDINIIATGLVPAGACAFFVAATQTDPKFRCQAYGVNFARPGVTYNPNLLVGGTVQTPVYRSGTYHTDNNGIQEVEIAYNYTRVGTTTSQISISLPTVPAAEYPTLSSTISGGVQVKFSSYKNALRAEIIPGSSSIVFYKADGTTLTEADLPSTFTITLRALYPTY